jgi:hypothetical protein
MSAKLTWRVYLERNSKTYRAFRVEQSNNSKDLVFSFPGRSICLPREVISSSEVGSSIKIQRAPHLNNTVDQYTVHNRTGQRHIKRKGNFEVALDVLVDSKLDEIKTAVPLFSVVCVASKYSEEQGTKGQWFGFHLPSDINYAIMDLDAIPKGTELKIQQAGIRINNERASVEVLDLPKNIEFSNCALAVIFRATNHMLTDIDSNIIFQQVAGKTLHISRVETDAVIGTVTELRTNTI